MFASGVLRAIYHGLGTACGTIIGGGLLTLIGPAAALRAWALVAVMVLVTFTYGLRELNSRDSNYYTLLLGICSETKESTNISNGKRNIKEAALLSPNSGSGRRSGKNSPTEIVGLKKCTELGSKSVVDSDDDSDFELGDTKFNLFGL